MPLDGVLGWEGACTTAAVKLMCQAASVAPRLHEALDIVSAAPAPAKPNADASSRRPIWMHGAAPSPSSARTDYRRSPHEGLFLGSGVFEAGCKTAVARRLKQAGAGKILIPCGMVLGQNFHDACASLKKSKSKVTWV